MKKIRLSLYQGRIGHGVPDSDLRQIVDYEPDFTILPEYFWVNPGAADQNSAAASFESSLKSIEKLSRKLPGCLISGTAIEPADGALYNTCYILKGGEFIGKYRKINLYGREREILTPGNEYYVEDLGGVRVGILICADNLQFSSFIKMRDLGVEIIFAPTFSITNPDDTPGSKLKRDRQIFLKGAKAADAVLAKCCSVGTVFGHQANGRSLICDADGFIYRNDEESEKIVKVINTEIEI